MSKVKGQRSKVDYNKGFTLIELMIVLVIFVLISGVILANYAGLRTSRNLKIAQNELVSNFRKVESYTLSSRALNGTQAVQYYLLKFDTLTPDRYFIEAIYNVTSSPRRSEGVETLYLPQGIRISATTPYQIDRPAIQYPANPSDSIDVSTVNANLNSCVLVAFKLPFGNIITNGGVDPINSSNTGCRFNNFSNDDYTKIKDFVANSPSNTASNNSIITLTLSSADGKLSKTVTLNGLTGAVTFSQ